jgi:hypothetical protein
MTLPLAAFAAVLLTVGGGLVLSGWGAGTETATPIEEVDARPVIPSGSLEEDDLFARAESLEQREDALLQREQAVERQEQSLDKKKRDLNARVESVDQRPAAAPAATDPAVRQPADDVAYSETPGSVYGEEPERFALEEPATRTIWVTLPAATKLKVEFLDTISTDTGAAGDPVRASVVKDVIRDDLVVIPAGSQVRGMVSEISPAKKIGGQAALALDFDRIDLPSGETVYIQGSLGAEGKSQTKKDAATIAGSAAGGAVLGRILSKDEAKGTLLGAVLGGAVGTAIASKNAQDPVVIERGMTAKVFLDQPVKVAVTETVPPQEIARNR